jgi:hypothetical protein
MKRLNEIGNIHWHLLNLSAVELLDFSHHADILGGDKVDGNSLSSETTSTTDSMDVVLTVGGEIIVDDQRDLLDIDTTGQEIGGDQDAGRAGSELLHNQITLTLVHVTVHGRDSKVAGSELVGKPVDLSSGVAKDNCLCNGDGLVEIRKCVQLPILLLNGNIKLLDTFEGKLGLLDQDTDGVAHELGGNLEDILGHSGGQKDNLSGLWKELEDVVDLLGETTRKHLIGLIENEHLHGVGLQETTLNHVVDTARSTDNDLRALLESLHVIANAGTTDTCVALDVHEVANSDDNLLDLLSQFTGGGEDQGLALLDVGVELLENRDGESGSLSGTRLSLRNNIVALDDWHDSALLDSRWALETVGVDTSEKLRLQVHGIEGVDGLVIVGLDLTFWDLLETLIGGSHDCGR